jgi:hypothetical protein
MQKKRAAGGKLSGRVFVYPFFQNAFSAPHTAFGSMDGNGMKVRGKEACVLLA